MIQPSCKKYNSLMTNSTAFVGHNAKATMELPWFFVQGQTDKNWVVRGICSFSI